MEGEGIPEGAVEKKAVPELPRPVKIGDELEVTVNAIGGKGDGIAKKERFVIFVQGGQKGETARVRIIELKRSFAVAQKI
ncbi:MAG: TRAM domain-containing protein [Candidatus Bilamarchaeaceae archaeon]